MLFLPHAWTYVLGESNLRWGMGGSYRMVRRSHNQWYSLQATQNSRTNQREWSKFSMNMPFGSMVSWWSAETSIRWPQSIVAPNIFSRHSQILESNNHLSRKPLRLLVTSPSFSQSSIVNLTSLNISGVQSRSIYVIIATTLLQHYRRICQRLLSLWLLRQSGSGNIECGVGWMPMMMGWLHMRLSFMSRNLAHINTSPTNKYQRVWGCSLTTD